MRSLWTFLGILTLLLSVVCKKRARKCPSPICQPGSPGAINVHILPHSHLDVGRTSTVDAYYTDFVGKILHSVTEQLSKHGNYRFTFSEMAFFHRWWTESDSKTRARVRSLIDRGVLEFSLGGWVSADEATVYYADAIDQLTLGRNFILREFGPCALPRVAWQLNTFGHARDHCGLFIPAGYDAVVFDRIDYTEKERRFRGKSLQLMWNTAYGPAENDHSASLFTHILSSSYCDEISNDVHRMIARIQDRMEGYQVNHIAFLMGCDFSYTNATEEFQKLDRLIRTIQGREIDGVPVNIFYSTPYCYTQAVNRALCSPKTILSRRSGDFMPYRMQGLAYWTGFYTSRPTIKLMVRQMSLLLHAAEQVSIFATVLPTNEVAIEKLRQEVAILQHHNAITGTHRAAVAKDYLQRVYKSSGPSEVLLSETVRLITSGMIHNTDRFESCRLRNISICLPSTKSYAFILTVYNPLGWAMPSHWVHIPVRLEWPYHSFRIQLLDWKGSVSYPYQLIPVSMRTRRIPERLLAVEQTHTTGPLMEQISAIFADWASLDLRLYKDDRVEVEWTVGPIPVGGRVHNRNVIIRYTLESSTAQLAPYTPGEFFTDSAGRRLIRRVRGKRPDWNVTQPYVENDRISSNYYPVTNRIVVKGPDRDSNSSIPQMAFAVYPDRAEGASSLTDGQVELMLHRRLLSDGFLGMGETLDEMGEDGRGLIVRGKHVIRLAEWKVLSAEDRYMAESVTRPPVELFAPSESFNVKDTTLTTWSGLTRQLPAEIHLVSLMRWPLSFKGKREKVNNILLRLDYNPIREERNPHLYELVIHDLFRYMCISQAKEVSLSGDQSISEMLGNRMKWPGETVHSAMTNHVRKNRTGLVLLLQSGKIQTYILTFARFKRTCF
ncbi:Alpha-mannosidase [Fasciola gigantica]|uniref:Alpha-mannosidase n=1 Tax=Fasciola gigantica TaxID=46835 RepID=A0A504YF85_FASGI|nr:Alpha-mannosidase [Fasciola gigantica]